MNNLALVPGAAVAVLVLLAADEQTRRQDMLAINGAALDGEVQELGVQALLHARETGDIRLLDRLVGKLPKGYRVEGFKVWVTTFSPIRWNGDGKIGLLREGYDKTFTPFNVEGANANPFWTLKAAKERTAKAMSVASVRAMIRNMLADVESADANGIIHDKKGQPKAKIEGNKADLDAYLRKAAAA